MDQIHNKKYGNNDQCSKKKIPKVQQKTGVKQTRTGALQQQWHDQVPWMLH